MSSPRNHWVKKAATVGRKSSRMKEPDYGTTASVWCRGRCLGRKQEQAVRETQMGSRPVASAALCHDLPCGFSLSNIP